MQILPMLSVVEKTRTISCMGFANEHHCIFLLTITAKSILRFCSNQEDNSRASFKPLFIEHIEQIETYFCDVKSVYLMLSSKI